MNRNFITEISTLYTSSHTYQIQAELDKKQSPPSLSYIHTQKGMLFPCRKYSSEQL